MADVTEEAIMNIATELGQKLADHFIRSKALQLAVQNEKTSADRAEEVVQDARVFEKYIRG